MIKTEIMDLDLEITGKDEATYNETLNRNGIKVKVRVNMVRESLVAKYTIKKRLMEQSTTRVNIDVDVTDGKTKVVTNAGAFALNLRGYEVSNLGLRVSAAPPGTVYDETLNSRVLAVIVAKKIMKAAIREQSHNGPSKLVETLDLLGKVVKNFAIDMNIMKLNVHGLEPFMTAKHSRSFCKTDLWVTDSSPNAASVGDNRRDGNANME